MNNACELPSIAKKDERLCKMLDDTKTIAIVGLSPKEHRDSNAVARYLQSEGFEIIPVYPREEFILGQKVYRTLDEIPQKVDMVVVFRKGSDTPPIAHKAAQINAKYLWLQEGVVNDETMQIAQEAGITAVQDRCVMIEHKRCKNA
ncbi:MAG: CoA-binding protein [Epsilonproteobacteria bacterium]|nr:CoA-binding protein [Campylobacterota bacterium]